jgi:hypothetical protein
VPSLSPFVAFTPATFAHLSCPSCRGRWPPKGVRRQN